MVTKQGIEEFKELVKSELGIELTQEQASSEANNFLNLFKTLQQSKSISPILKNPIVKKIKTNQYEA